MKKLLILLCLMFPLMAQSVNDTDEAKKEIREQRMEQHQMQQEKMWKQKDHNRKAGIEEMMLKMKMHDRKMVNDHKNEWKKFNHMHKKSHQHHTNNKTKKIIGGIVIFSLGYIIGNNDEHRGNKNHKKDKNFGGDR